MDEQTRIRIVVSHSLPLVQSGLEATLADQLDVALAQGWLPDQRARDLPADARVVILDTATGFRIAEELRRGEGPQNCSVMVVADQAGEHDLRQAIASGVLGFYLLGSSLERILAGIRQLARGNRSFDESAAAKLADCFAQPHLTVRERDVLGLIVDGSCNKEVAKALGIAVGTVKGHVRVLLEKLEVRSRVQAVIVAKQRGLVGRSEASWPLLPRRSGSASLLCQ